MRKQRNAKRHAPRLETLEERLCLDGSVGWDGRGLGSAALTYYIGAVPSSFSLNQATVQAALQTALGAWAAVADVTFTQTSQPNQPDSIDFTFGTIDGPGGTLAEGYSPDDVNPALIAGDILFDATEVWEVGDALGWSALDLVNTAAHEIGHALGLGHSNVAGSLMAPTTTPDGQFTGLAPTDVASILALYAPARLKTSTTPTAPTTTIRTTPTAPTTTPTAPTAPTTTPTPTAPTTTPTAPTTTRTIPTPPPTVPTTTRTTSPTVPTTTRTTPPSTPAAPAAPPVVTPPAVPAAPPTTATAPTTTPTGENDVPITSTSPDENPVVPPVAKSSRIPGLRRLNWLRRQRRLRRLVA